jgi:Asp/Glu/hydantoin racemase
MSNGILVINPNSNKEVTAAIDCALDPLRTPDAPPIECMTIAEGPYGIECQRDADAAAPNVSRVIEENASKAAAFVVACYSDPGLRAAREVTDKPVFGMAETGLATALSLGGKIGVISILPAAVERHWVYARSLQLDNRVVADLPVGLTVAELANEDATTARMLSTGRRLREEHGATVILLGCAGMARYRKILQEELQLVVIDPTQAAVAAAITALRLDYQVRS